MGKVRPMGIPTYDWDLLGPLHKCIYQHISRKSWCLRGAPTSRRVTKVMEGKAWATSVDLVSATDGLRIDAAEAILGALLAKAKYVPGRIRLHAFESLRPCIRGKEVTHGQQMGTYLSFPLLCLQSYLAARWATRGQQASYLVNGDDCLIGSDRPIQNSDYPEGFQINEKKTMRARNAAEINSTQFLFRRGKWEEVRSVRRGAFQSDLPGILHFSAVIKAAGPKWVDALLKSRLIKDYKPSQLGFDPLDSSTLWAAEERCKRRGWYELCPPPEPPTRFERMRSRPYYGDRVAFAKDLFEGDREGGDQSSWSKKWTEGRLFYMKTKRYKSFLSSVPYGTARKLPRVRRPPQEEVYCYSSLVDPIYESDKVLMREQVVDFVSSPV